MYITGTLQSGQFVSATDIDVNGMQVYITYIDDVGDLQVEVDDIYTSAIMSGCTIVQ